MNRGLVFPKVSVWPSFICEACTVRAVVNRELHSREDYALLALERMRLIDVAHYWAPSTHLKYQDKLRFLTKFQDQFPGLTILNQRSPERPPSGVDIPVMWAEEAYSLRPGKHDTPVSFGTIRSLRSALSQFEAIRAIHSGVSTRFDQQKRLLFQDCRTTDQAPPHVVHFGAFGSYWNRVKTGGGPFDAPY